jgi:hypothetical protein
MEWYLSALKGVKQINIKDKLHRVDIIVSTFTGVILYFALSFALRLTVLYKVCLEIKYLGRERG